ncbi:MAG: hypothetical protein NWE93_02010 [Candidatus Bathyarchaeota archaeon]|nr:hypothetical protein [Candidatus Bathyarchaeota archaeon]
MTSEAVAALKEQSSRVFVFEESAFAVGREKVEAEKLISIKQERIKTEADRAHFMGYHH